MPNAFMSYSSKDAVFAELTRMKLEDAKIQVWMDQGALHAGDEWRNAIDEGIASADVLLIILTPDSSDSPYVTYEWAFALGKGIKVIPLLLADCDIHPRLAVLQYLDFRNQKAAPWAALAHEVEKHSGLSQRKDASSYVRDMTVNQFQDLISGAVSLATAMAKTSGQAAAPEDVSRAAQSVAEAMQHVKEAERTSAKKAQPKQVLWVDDRPENNVNERAAFVAMGCSFTLALSTNEALDLLSKKRFDAIISDMGRREGSQEGYVLLDALRGREDKTPFFIYAGSSSTKHKREAALRGAQGSTSNPQELFELVSRSIL